VQLLGFDTGGAMIITMFIGLASVAGLLVLRLVLLLSSAPVKARRVTVDATVR
jgi:hypothetical protein